MRNKKHVLGIFIIHRPHQSYEDSVKETLCSYPIPSCFLWSTNFINYAQKKPKEEKPLMKYLCKKNSVPYPKQIFKLDSTAIGKQFSERATQTEEITEENDLQGQVLNNMMIDSHDHGIIEWVY